MKLKAGVEICHKKKTYSGEIPDTVFEEIYGKGKKNDKAKDKFKLVESKLSKSMKA